jgi:Flp pilus assembly protein TadB
VSNPSNPDVNPTPSAFRRIWSGLKAYLTDWRNLLGHALLGVVFVVVAVWAPITLWLKLIIIAILITLNVLRMRNKNKKKEVKEGTAE